MIELLVTIVIIYVVAVIAINVLGMIVGMLTK